MGASGGGVGGVGAGGGGVEGGIGGEASMETGELAARPSVLRRRSFSFGACTVETVCRVDGAVDAASAWQPGAHSSGGSVDPELEKRCAGLSTCEAPPHGTS